MLKKIGETLLGWNIPLIFRVFIDILHIYDIYFIMIIIIIIEIILKLD